MKEIFEFRINYDYATKLFSADEGRDLGQSVKVITITKEDPRFIQIPVLDHEVQRNFKRSFYFGWNLYHKYSRKEIESAVLFNVRIRPTFEPAGEDSGTEYDEHTACEICGADRRQIGYLYLKKGSVPKKDIARTIAGEVVVSEKFRERFLTYGLNGLTFEPVVFGKDITSIYQPKITSPALELTGNTLAGIDPFDLSESSAGEIYKCPKGHTIGLNLLSEAYVADSSAIAEYDFFATRQRIGVRRGLLRPQPLYLCSQAFRQMVEKEKLTGFDFEVAHIER